MPSTMEDTDKVESIYVKGFNEGYIIAQQMPELADILAKVESNSERLNGFKAGRKQYNKEQIEQLKSHLPGWLKSDRPAKEQGSLEKNRDHDMDLEK